MAASVGAQQDEKPQARDLRLKLIWRGRAPDDLLVELLARRFGPWRHFDIRGAALHEWHPPPPTRPTQRSTITITNTRGVDLDFVHRIWHYYQRAAEHFDVELPGILEHEAISRIRTGCRLDTHCDYQTAVLSMSIMLTDPSDYDGGNFYIHDGDTIQVIGRPPRGTVLIFRSQTRHGVTRVTRGRRLTYVSKALSAPNPEVDTVNVHTGQLRSATPPSQRELGRRSRVQTEHNQRAAHAWRDSDPVAMQAAIDWLWAHR